MSETRNEPAGPVPGHVETKLEVKSWWFPY